MTASVGPDLALPARAVAAIDHDDRRRTMRRIDAREQDARVTDATNRLSWMTEADHEHTALRLMAEARLTSKQEVATRAYTGAVAHLLMADRLQRARTADPAHS